MNVKKYFALFSLFVFYLLKPPKKGLFFAAKFYPLLFLTKICAKKRQFYVFTILRFCDIITDVMIYEWANT